MPNVMRPPRSGSKRVSVTKISDLSTTRPRRNPYSPYLPVSGYRIGAVACSYVPMRPAYDVGLYLNDNVKLYIAEHPWVPPADFKWPSSTHKRKDNKGIVRDEVRKLSSSHLKMFDWASYS